jgi:hypothetical protein
VSSAVPKLSEDHIEFLQRTLREIIAEQAYSADDIDDEDVDDEWVDWVETYEEAIEGLERLGIDPYDDPLEWIEFLDPMGGFPRENKPRDEARFLEYLAETYGVAKG